MPGAGVSSTSLPPGPLIEGSARLELLGIPVDRCTLAGALDRCERAVTEGGRPLQVVTLNPEMIMQARRQPELAQAIRQAGLVLPDGAGVIWGARRLGAALPDRIAGADFLELLADMAAQRNWSLFLLGAAPGVAEAAGQRLQGEHSGLRIAGTWAGSPEGSEAAAICARVRESGATLLAVAFGVPEQDLWISHHLDASGARIGIGVGGTLDYLAGRVPRAPIMLRRMGLEWTFRLVRQPWRLPRMLRGGRFFWAIWRDASRARQR
ncbi:MAG: WecB/TagA/CpsF family glycosyltransferase [Candidatus Dormiibacterota bacterium]